MNRSTATTTVIAALLLLASTLLTACGGSDEACADGQFCLVADTAALCPEDPSTFIGPLLPQCLVEQPKDLP